MAVKLDIRIRNRSIICGCEWCNYYNSLNVHPSLDCFVDTKDYRYRELPLTVEAVEEWVAEQEQRHQDIHHKWMSQGS